MSDYFWFEAQTGNIYHKPPAAPSNYHRYCLLNEHLAKVKLAVDNATIGSAGLQYPSEFLRWLERNDMSTRQPRFPRG